MAAFSLYVKKGLIGCQEATGILHAPLHHIEQIAAEKIVHRVSRPIERTKEENGPRKTSEGKRKSKPLIAQDDDEGTISDTAVMGSKMFAHSK